MLLEIAPLTLVPQNICNDVIRLRIIYLVLAAMSGWSSVMSKELYQEALRHIAPLGTIPEGPATVPGRSIELSDSQNARDDIHRLSCVAEKVARSLDQVCGLLGLYFDGLDLTL